MIPGWKTSLIANLRVSGDLVSAPQDISQRACANVLWLHPLVETMDTSESILLNYYLPTEEWALNIGPGLGVNRKEINSMELSLHFRRC